LLIFFRKILYFIFGLYSKNICRILGFEWIARQRKIDDPIYSFPWRFICHCGAEKIVAITAKCVSSASPHGLWRQVISFWTIAFRHACTLVKSAAWERLTEGCTFLRTLIFHNDPPSIIAIFLGVTCVTGRAKSAAHLILQSKGRRKHEF